MDTTSVFDFIVPEALQYSVSHLQEKHYSHYEGQRILETLCPIKYALRAEGELREHLEDLTHED